MSLVDIDAEVLVVAGFKHIADGLGGVFRQAVFGQQVGTEVHDGVEVEVKDGGTYFHTYKLRRPVCLAGLHTMI